MDENSIETTLEEREKELVLREAELGRRERRALVGEELLKRSLPKELCALVPLDSDEGVKAGLDALETAFTGAVAAALQKKLGGVSLKSGTRGERELSDKEYYESVIKKKRL